VTTEHTRGIPLFQSRSSTGPLPARIRRTGPAGRRLPRITRGRCSDQVVDDWKAALPRRPTRPNDTTCEQRPRRAPRRARLVQRQHSSRSQSPKLKVGSDFPGKATKLRTTVVVVEPRPMHEPEQRTTSERRAATNTTTTRPPPITTATCSILPTIPVFFEHCCPRYRHPARIRRIGPASRKRGRPRLKCGDGFSDLVIVVRWDPVLLKQSARQTRPTAAGCPMGNRAVWSDTAGSPESR
jgi:hypothetical protein